MLRFAVSGLALVSFAVVFAASPKPAAALKTKGPPQSLSFNENVQPILAENCYACHGADPGSRKAGLRLDRAEHAFKPLEKSGPAIVPFKPADSPLVQRIESTDDKQRMPPPEANKTLGPDQIATLRQWIAEGAEYEEHWSFISAKRPRVPAVAALKKPKSPIDSFVAQRLAKDGLTMSPEADRRALLRRVTLYLTGVIPTSAEVEAFVNDRSRDAYEKVVDRLLASPRFGEHRTRYWLDYVRYADTHGIHFDNLRAIWPYRDYVIRAFNSNKPFDTFIREQLAGDLLPVRNFDGLVATGFVRNNMTTNEGGTITEEIMVNQTRDRVEAFGATFLGLTTGCAACHDHKFDPFTQKDHYSLAAFLGNTAEKPWDLNIADPEPVLRLPKEEMRTSAEFVLLARTDLSERYEARRKRGSELMAEWLRAGNRPLPVATDGLDLRLKLDEGSGQVVKNSAPGAKVSEFKADTNPIVWGENTFLWPSMRMDILSRLSLGEMGDVDATDKFSAGGWFMLRAKPGGGIKAGTGNGALMARMGDEKRKGGAGWDIFHDSLQIVVNLVPDTTPAITTNQPVATAGETAKDPAAPVAAVAPASAVTPALASAVPVKRGIQVVTRVGQFVRDDWVHVFVTYDGSKKASGVKIYLNGKVAETEVKLDTLAPGDSMRTDAAMHLGRRDDYLPMRETRYQDVRFYRRALATDEVSRLPFEDVASEIVARESDPGKWSTDGRFVALEKFFLGEKDAPTMTLASAVAAHDIALEALTREGTATLIAREKPTPAYADILKRGDYYARGERVEPAVPHFLPPLPNDAPANRRGLAEWLLMPEQPLMGRVTVNRIWQELFGRGLVESAGDFGIMGDRPSHPELLDWLAVELRESGWDVKRFYRLIVTSATYRQTASVTPERLAKDPTNKWLSRGPRFRMDGEMLRDNALMASGLLVEKIGGPPTKPYHPPGIWEEVAMPESNTKTYVQDKGDGLYRRSVYTFWKRASPPAGFETFDATSREVVCTRRARTNTPLQAFVTMNDPQWVEAARKLAERALKAAPSTKARLAFLAEATLGRVLVDKEVAVLTRSLDTFHQKFATAEAGEDVRALLAVGETKSDESLALSELAAWMMVASQFLNLDEFLTK